MLPDLIPLVLFVETQEEFLAAITAGKGRILAANHGV